MTSKTNRLGRLTFEEDDPVFIILRNKKNSRTPDLLLKIHEGVGRAQPNRRADVARIELLMERQGFYDTSRTEGPTGLFSLPLEKSIQNFQKQNHLRSDGLVFPKGETVRALAKNVSSDQSGNNKKMPSAPLGEVKREPLHEPKIPGTNIPDRGIPEHGVPRLRPPGVDPDSPRYKIDPDIEKRPPLTGPYMPIINKPIKRKPRKPFV